jgi:hypothetical protein
LEACELNVKNKLRDASLLHMKRASMWIENE